MTFDDYNNEISTYYGDYGVPIVFEAGKDEGFNIGDKVIFVFNTGAISDREYTVNADDYTFSLSLTKAEADTLFNQHRGNISYSAKRYSESGEFLETLINGMLVAKETLQWQN